MAQLRDLRLRRFTGREHLVRIEFVRENGCQRQIGVVSCLGIALQLLPAPSESYDLPRQPHVPPNQIDDITWIKKKRARPRQRRTTLFPVFAPEIAALE